MFHIKQILFISVCVIMVKSSTQSPLKTDDSDVDVNLDISCISNEACVKNVSQKVVRALNMQKIVDFGLFAIEPLRSSKPEEGRSLRNFVENNALRIPIGSYSLSLQKSNDYNNYFEVSISKPVEGRGRYEKKQMQFFVPAFLVASQVGWWVLALAGVSLLAIKAFLVSKLALFFGAVMTFKKLFEHHHGIPPHFYEHHEPLMVPYNFDLSGFSGPSGFPSDFHQPLPLGHESAALHQNGALGAETNNVIANVTAGSPITNTPGLSAYATVARHPPIGFNYLKNPFLRKPY